MSESLRVRQLQMAEGASYLLPDPGGEVVRDFIEQLRSALSEIEQLRADNEKLRRAAENKSRPTFRMTVIELRDALDLVNPDGRDSDDQLECEIAFFYRDTPDVLTDGDPMPVGWYCYDPEYPEEGCNGPLGKPAGGTDRGATMKGQASDLDPDAMVKNLVYALFGVLPHD